MGKIIDRMKNWATRSISKKNMQVVSQLVQLLNSRYSPIDIFGREIYDVPEIRNAINKVAEKVAMVPFDHVRQDQKGKKDQIFSSIHYVLTVRANPYQTPTAFKTCMVTRLYLYNNCFVLPEWDSKGNLLALWPLPFSRCEYKTDQDGAVWIVFQASNGPYEFPVEDIIHLMRFPDLKHGALRQATGDYIQVVKSLQNQAVKDAESSGKVNAIMKTMTDLKPEHMKRKLEEFKELFLTSENTTGMGMVGPTYDITPLNLKTVVLKADVLKEVTNRLLNYFGTSEEIINNTASDLHYEQWIDDEIKPPVQQISEAFTYSLFSYQEIVRGNKIDGDTVALEISTLSAKTAFIDKTMYHGVINANEARKFVGLSRGPDELDKYRPNLNGVDSKKIDEYQNGKGGEEENETFTAE